MVIRTLLCSKTSIDGIVAILFNNVVIFNDLIAFWVRVGWLDGDSVDVVVAVAVVFLVDIGGIDLFVLVIVVECIFAVFDAGCGTVDVGAGVVIGVVVDVNDVVAADVVIAANFDVVVAAVVVDNVILDVILGNSVSLNSFAITSIAVFVAIVVIAGVWIALDNVLVVVDGVI